MPNSLISHQTPGMLLKIKLPRKIDGTAICIGAFVPDLNTFVDLFTDLRFRNITHSLLGQIIWTVPITILLTIIFCRYIAPFIAKFARNTSFFSKPLRYFGFDEFNHLEKKEFDKRLIVVAIYSAFIGGFSHIILDLPSHQYVELFYPWLLIQTSDFLSIPFIIFETFEFGGKEFILSTFTMIWTIEDIIFLITSLYLLRYIKKNMMLQKWYEN
jgi:membrane-bound metal-dependent hydrolase YbcI (DUF457 family)